MRSLGYSDSANTEVCAALGILAKYGVLGVGVGLSNGNHSAAAAAASNPLSYLNVSALDQQNSQQTVGNVFGSIGGSLESFINSQQNQQSRNMSDRFDSAFDPFRNQATAPISLNNNTFGLATTPAQMNAHSLGALSKSPTPGEIGSKDSKNVEIPEVIVGAILGEFLSLDLVLL
jgi:RNA-binding protein Nova